MPRCNGRVRGMGSGFGDLCDWISVLKSSHKVQEAQRVNDHLSCALVFAFGSDCVPAFAS